jgi:hypothetical protein
MSEFINRYIEEYNKKLISSLDKASYSLGLADGEMGFSIYFYTMGEWYGNKEYKKNAKKLLDHICRNAKNIQTIDVKSGLAGIGLGIRYLITQKHVAGNINVILKDIDNVIFKHLSYDSDNMDSIALIHVIYYLNLRLRDQVSASESEYLYQELIIQSLNNLYDGVDVVFFEEPPSYHIDYKLPLLLRLLSEIYNQKFYDYRVIQIVNELSDKVLSTYPLSHANRLFLLWGMIALKPVVKRKKPWEEHMQLLKDELSIDSIFHNELKNGHIIFQNGVTSIYFLMKSLESIFSEQELNGFRKNIYSKIESSYNWRELIENDQYFNNYNGLINGFGLVSLVYLQNSAI